MPSRPKRSGLWVLLTLLDGTEVTGIMDQDLRLMRPEGIEIRLPGRRFATGLAPGECRAICFPRRELTGAVVIGVNGARKKFLG